jgi:hypothetical protein
VKFSALLFATATGTGIATLTTAAWSFAADVVLVQFATAIAAAVFCSLTVTFYLMVVLSLIETVDRIIDRSPF